VAGSEADSVAGTNAGSGTDADACADDDAGDAVIAGAGIDANAGDGPWPVGTAPGSPLTVLVRGELCEEPSEPVLATAGLLPGASP